MYGNVWSEQRKKNNVIVNVWRHIYFSFHAAFKYEKRCYLRRCLLCVFVSSMAIIVTRKHDRQHTKQIYTYILLFFFPIWLLFRFFLSLSIFHFIGTLIHFCCGDTLLGDSRQYAKFATFFFFAREKKNKLFCKQNIKLYSFKFLFEKNGICGWNTPTTITHLKDIEKIAIHKRNSLNSYNNNNEKKNRNYIFLRFYFIAVDCLMW